MAKWLKDLFEDYMEEELVEGIKPSTDTAVVIGGVYFGSLRSLNENKPNKPLYFIIVDKVDDDMYEVLKASDRYEFATSRDVLLDVPGLTVMVEVSNNFYLTEDEIKRFVLINQLKSQDVQDILLFRDGEEPSRPLRIGVTPIYEEDIRNKFKQEEFNQIKDFHMRIFALLQEEEEVIEGEAFDDEEEWVEPIEERWIYPHP